MYVMLQDAVDLPICCLRRNDGHRANRLHRCEESRSAIDLNIYHLLCVWIMYPAPTHRV